MIAYKGFRPGMICIDYQFQMGLNVTDKANCRQNGFHCAENPLDCLNYYGDIDHSEYYIVNAGGDIDEDEVDSKISCTELTVLKRLTKEELLLHGLAFMADHPKREWNSHVRKDQAEACDGYAAVRGADPIAKGRRKGDVLAADPIAKGCRKGDVLAFAKEDPATGSIQQIVVATIDGKTLLPNVWYGANLEKRMVS